MYPCDLPRTHGQAAVAAIVIGELSILQHRDFVDLAVPFPDQLGPRLADGSWHSGLGEAPRYGIELGGRKLEQCPAAQAAKCFLLQLVAYT